MTKDDPEQMNPNELVKLLREELSKITMKEIDFLAERVRALIEYSIDRVDYYENYRTQFLNYSGTLLVFSVAFAAFIISYPGFPKIALPIFVLGVAVLILACLANVILYLWDSINPSYPHRAVSQTQWYYLYNLNRLDRNKEDYVGDADSKTRKWLLDFRDNVKKMSGQGKEEMVLDDMEQLVMLYIITAYKKKFAGRMQNALAIGIILFAGIMFIGILSML